MRVRSLVGLLPLMTGVILEEEKIDKLPGFKRRMEWFLNNRDDLSQHMTYMETHGSDEKKGLRLLAIPSEDRFRQLLSVMLDECEFLSPYGIRSMSKAHQDEPFVFEFGGQKHQVRYVPGESETGMFGGNSNWRGPIWFPTNFLLIQSLKRYHAFYGDSFRVECPTGTGHSMNLIEVAQELERRMILLFERDGDGRRAAHGTDSLYADDPHWKELVLYYEYFHADSGKGLGASHQTGWTALVASMLRSQAKIPKHAPIVQ